jgi:hypothetical protein
LHYPYYQTILATDDYNDFIDVNMATHSC